MRTFTQKQNKAQQPTSFDVTRARRIAPLANRAMLPVPGSHRFGHDFSQLSVQAPSSENIGEKLGSASVSAFEREVDRNDPRLAIQKRSLEVSSPSDADEKEAEEVARKVVDGQPVEIHGTGRSLTSQAEGSAETTPEFQSQLEKNKSGGQSLAAPIRREMESKMSADFSAVKIHTGSAAHEMNESINAKAFTHGQSIFFRQGHFATGSRQASELLAHELVHTRQQSHGFQTNVQRQPQPQTSKTPYLRQPILLPHYFKKTDALFIYTKSQTSTILVHTQIGTADFSLSIAKGTDLLFSVKTAEKGIQGLKPYKWANTQDLCLVFELAPRPIIAGEGWTGSAYERVYKNLSKSSGTYRKELSDYAGPKADYDVEMSYSKYDYGNKKRPEERKQEQAALGSTFTGTLFYSDPKQTHDVPPDSQTAIKGHTAYINFAPKSEHKKKGETTVSLNDLGRALTLIHEGIHLNIFIHDAQATNEGAKAEHEFISGSAYRDQIVSALREFVKANKLLVPDIDLQLMSWYGLFYSKGSYQNFKNWVKNNEIADPLAKALGPIDLNDVSKVITWTDKFRERVEASIYNTPSQQASGRYTIK